MTTFDLETRIIAVNQCIDALVLLTQRREYHGLDKVLLEEEVKELIRARHDHIREFESECVKRGKTAAAEEIASRLSVKDSDVNYVKPADWVS